MTDRPTLDLQPSPALLEADPVTADWPMDASIKREQVPKLHGLAECKSEPIPGDSLWARFVRATCESLKLAWPEWM